MNKTPILSIVTINYNDDLGLIKTINSVKNQLFKNYEYIIIDGGSTDDSKKILEEQRAFIDICISEPDNGIYDAMNKGLKYVTGEWVMFLNSGDLLYENISLESIFKSQKLSRFDVLYGDVVIQKETTLTNVIPSELCSFFYKMPFCHQSSIVKTSLLKDRGFDVKYKIGADFDFLCELYREKKKFKKLNLSFTVFTDGGISTVNTDLMYKEFSEISAVRFKGCFRIKMYLCYKIHVLKRKTLSVFQ